MFKKLTSFCGAVADCVGGAWNSLSGRNKRMIVGVGGAVGAGALQAQAAFVSVNSTTGFLDFDWTVPIAALLNNIAAIFIGVLPIVLAGITLAWGYSLMQGRLKKK